MGAGLIHCGAWTGVEFAGSDRALLLFEPQSAAFDALRRNLGERPGLVLVNAAAGASPGEATMYRVSPDHSSSLLRPGALRPGFRHDGEETVRVTTIDLTVKKLGLRGIHDELVIDTQGYELEVLKGACGTLTTDIRRVQCELHDSSAYPGAAMLGDIDEFLAALGFPRIALTHCGDDWGDATYEKEI